MVTEGDRETRDDVLLAALGEGLSHRKAAAAAGVSLATVTRRLREEGFRERVRVEREARVEEAVAMLEGASVKAAATMIDLLDSEAPIARHKASADILNRSEARQQARAFGDRLARLERSVEEALAGRPLRGVA